MENIYDPNPRRNPPADDVFSPRLKLEYAKSSNGDAMVCPHCGSSTIKHNGRCLFPFFNVVVIRFNCISCKKDFSLGITNNDNGTAHIGWNSHEG